MIHTDRFVMKPQLVGLTASVLHLTVVLLFQTHSCGGSVSSPGIKISRVSSGALLECKSKGWYPEPDVLWLDGEEKLLSAGPTETVRGPDGLYTVSSRVTVEKRHNNNFTCRVQQRNISQTRETQIQIPDDLFMVQSSPAVHITICVVVCVMSVVAVSLIVWKGGQNKTETNNTNNTDKTNNTNNANNTDINISELQRLMEAERDKERLLTGSEKIRYLNNTKAKLDEELQKTEGELQHVQQVIKSLTEQKEDLKDQKKKLIELQQEEVEKIKEKKEDLGKARFLDEDKKNKKHKKYIEDLMKEKEEHEKLLKNTEKLLKTTEDLIDKMMERKAELERDVEQINKNLTETQIQIEESQNEERQTEESQTEESQRTLEAERQTEESQSVQLVQSETKEERNDPPSNDPEFNEFLI